MAATKLLIDLASGLSNGYRALIWLPQYEMGYCPPSPSASQLYDEAYFEEYKKRAATPMGEALTRERCQLVQSFHDSAILDVGIGCGQFLQTYTRGWCWGYDINPLAESWLKERNRWWNPYEQPAEAITCWDSLEHIPEPEALLAHVKEWVFTSLPIFRDAEHALKSKHFKPDEHLWYWTANGFVRWMRECGFDCRFRGDIEKQLGREDIETFVFKRL